MVQSMAMASGPHESFMNPRSRIRSGVLRAYSGVVDDSENVILGDLQNWKGRCELEVLVSPRMVP